MNRKTRPKNQIGSPGGPLTMAPKRARALKMRRTPLGGPYIYKPSCDLKSLISRLLAEDDGGYVYRGQTKLYSKKSLQPSVFRKPSFVGTFHSMGINAAAEAYFRLSFPRVTKMRFSRFYPAFPGEILPAALAQHYDFKSNMIDVTFDINIAASFAVERKKNLNRSRLGAIFRWAVKGLYPLLSDLRQVRHELKKVSFAGLSTKSKLRPEVQKAGCITMPWQFEKGIFRLRDDLIKDAEIFTFFHIKNEDDEFMSEHDLFPNRFDPIYAFFEKWKHSEITPLSIITWKLFLSYEARFEASSVPPA